MSWLAIILVFALIGAFSASVIYALWWALRGGQMSDFQKGATSIFDEEEPIGRVTDTLLLNKEQKPQINADKRR